MTKLFKTKKSVLKNFTPEEFDCKETGKKGFKHMDLDFLEKLQELRDLYMEPIIITSAYRDPSHSKDEFARGKSHVNGIESFWSYAKSVNGGLTIDKMTSMCYYTKCGSNLKFKIV